MAASHSNVKAEGLENTSFLFLRFLSLLSIAALLRPSAILVTRLNSHSSQHAHRDSHSPPGSSITGFRSHTHGSYPVIYTRVHDHKWTNPYTRPCHHQFASTRDAYGRWYVFPCRLRHLSNALLSPSYTDRHKY